MVEEYFDSTKLSTIPKNIAKNIIPSISPFASADIGFNGIILFKISKIELEELNFDVSNEPASLMVVAPTPGSILFAKKRPIKIAIRLVDT